MAKVLDVYFHEKIIGKLIQDDHGDMNFTYSASWLADPNAIKISCSLPLQPEIIKRKKYQGFFEGILPEESQRKLIAKNLSISANNDFSMLEKIGGECAGALSFIPTEEKLHPNNNDYHEISSSQLPNTTRITIPAITDTKMAMKLGGEYQIINIHPDNFDILANEIGFAKPEVRRRILELIDSILLSLPAIAVNNQAQKDVVEFIRIRCKKLATHFLGNSRLT